MQEKYKWQQAFKKVSELRPEVEALYKRMWERDKDGAVYILKKEDIELLHKSREAWEELLFIARQG